MRPSAARAAEPRLELRLLAGSDRGQKQVPYAHHDPRVHETVPRDRHRASTALDDTYWYRDQGQGNTYEASSAASNLHRKANNNIALRICAKQSTTRAPLIGTIEIQECCGTNTPRYMAAVTTSFMTFNELVMRNSVRISGRAR